MDINEFYSFCMGDLIPLIPGGKTPYDGWRVEPSCLRSVEDVYTLLKNGYNLGYRIPYGIMVIDVDPRNGGWEGYARLPGEIHQFPVTIATPSGGIHIYTQIPHTFEGRLKTTLKDKYPGLDFKKQGGYVMVPGTRLSSGLTYTLNTCAVLPPPVIPASLIEDLQKDPPAEDTGEVPGGYLDNADLAKCLENIPAEAYSDNDSWLNMMFACHHATAGTGLESFLQWSLSDPRYADHEQKIRARWESASVEGSALITARTLFYEINKHGPIPSWLRIKAGLSKESTEYFNPVEQARAAQTLETYKNRIEAEENYYNLVPGLITEIAADSALFDIHREMLFRAIAKKVNVPITTLKKDLRRISEPLKAKTTAPPSYNPGSSGEMQELDEAQINLRMAQNLLDLITEKCNGVMPIFTLGDWWLWSGRQWTNNISAADVRRAAIKVIQSWGVVVTPNNTNNVVDLAKYQVEVSPDVFQGDRTHLYIYAGNQVMHFNRDTASWSYGPHNPANRNTSIINANFNMDAPEPVVWRHFLNEAMTSTHAQRTLACAIIYAAGGSIPWLRKAFFFYGPKRSGKSTVLDLIESLLGPENCTALNIQQLGGKNGTAELVNRLANISNETLSKKAIQDDTFKALISGESVMVEAKYAQPFRFRNTAKFFLASNGFFRIEDESEAVWDRLTVLSFPNSVPAERADHSLHRKLYQEKDAILTWAWKIFTEEYRKDGCISVMEPDVAGQEVVKAWRMINNSAVEWISERLHRTNLPADQLTHIEAYSDYSTWCARNGHRASAKNQFTRILNKSLQSTPDSNKKPIYIGVQLAPREDFKPL